MSTEVLSKVKLEKIKRMIESVEKHYEADLERIADIDLSFEFVIASLFPDIFKRIEEKINHEHTLGFIEGYEAGKNEN